MKNFTISVNIPNNVVLVNVVREKPFMITSIFCDNNNTYFCVGREFKYLRNLYAQPIESKKLHIYYAYGESKSTTFSCTDIVSKFFPLLHKNGYALFPVSHTY